MVYNVIMRKYLIMVITVILCSCVFHGSGIKTVTGTLSGVLLTGNVKVGLFPKNDANTFIYDQFSTTEQDMIDQNKELEIVGIFPSVVVVSPAVDNTYSIIFPDDTATVKCLIAWDDLNDDDSFDLELEAAYLPVKTINSVENVVHHFTALDVTEVITYEAVYSSLDLLATDQSQHSDNFDAIGAGGFDFLFD